MPIRTLIVDDEPLARRRLRQLLRTASDIEVVAECGNGEEAIAAIRTTDPHLVFLDVQMPAPDGFGVVSAIGPDRMPVVVFVTAYDQYALRAFEAQALDYLLKPFDRERFERTLNRARAAVAQARPAVLTAQLIAWLDQHRQTPPASPATDTIVIRSTGRIAMVRVDEIDWIEAESNYARLHVGRESHLVRESMAALAARLAPARFRRIHRSTIVNLDRVKELKPSFRGDYVVTLRDGTRLTLSRNYRDELPELFG